MPRPVQRRFILDALMAAPLLTLGGLAQAQGRPMTIVVGSTAGGSTDTLARVLGKVLGEQLGRSVVIDNKPGANGTIADGLVARAAPDGNTLLMAAMAFTVNPLIYKKLPYDPLDSFTPLTMVARLPNLLVARKDAPFNTAAELIAYAKAHPGKLNFAVAGLGSSIHLATEDFKLPPGPTMLAVAYNGTSAALTDLMAGAVDLLFVGSASAMSHVQAGSVKAIGVTSKAPIAQLPNVPPLSATVPGFESSAWFGLMGPSKMDPRLTETLYQAIKACLSHPDMVAKLDAEAAIRVSYTPAEFSQFIRDEMTRLRDLVTRANIKFES